MEVTTAIILAGGFGTRLRSTVPSLPKPMAPIGSRPFLEYQLDARDGHGWHRGAGTRGRRACRGCAPGH